MFGFNKFSITKKLLIVFLSFGVIVAGLGGVALLSAKSLADRGDEVGKRFAPHIKAAMEIKLNTTAAHLQFEEIMGGDETEDIAEVWQKLDRADFYLGAIQSGATSGEEIYLASTDPNVLAAIPKVADALNAFRAAGEQRYAARGNGNEGVGSAADVAFDAGYDSIVAEASNLENLVHTDMQSGLQRLDMAQTLAVVTLLLAGLGAALGCLTVFLFFRKVVAARLIQLVGITAELAKGNTEVQIPAQQVSDELTVMYDAFERFRGALIEQAELERSEQERSTESGLRRRASDRLTEDLRETLQAFMSGQLSKRVSADYSQPELSGLAGEVNALLDAVDKGLTGTKKVLSALAQADLTKRVNGEFRGAFAELQHNTNAVADRLGELMGRLKDTSHLLKTATGEILAGSTISPSAPAARQPWCSRLPLPYPGSPAP